MSEELCRPDQFCECGGCHVARTRITELESQLSAMKERAEKAEETVQQCRAANFIDDIGAVRKVLGTLPLTEDGCVVGLNAKLWEIIPNHRGGIEFGLGRADIYSSDDWDEHPFPKCYSTKQAAEKAGRGDTDGNGG